MCSCNAVSLNGRQMNLLFLAFCSFHVNLFNLEILCFLYYVSLVMMLEIFLFCTDLYCYCCFNFCYVFCSRWWEKQNFSITAYMLVMFTCHCVCLETLKVVKEIGRKKHA